MSSLDRWDHPAPELNLAKQYGEAMSGLQAMGFQTEGRRSTVPKLEQVEAGLRSEPLYSWLLDRALDGDQDTLVIAPTVGGPRGIGMAELLNRRSDCPTRGVANTAVWGDKNGNGNPYGNNSVIHDNAGESGLATEWDTAVLLGDLIDPASGHPATFPGMVYNSLNVYEQREVFAAEAERLRGETGLELVTATVAHIAVESVIRHQKGEYRREGTNMFIHYPAQHLRFMVAPSDTVVPEAFAFPDSADLTFADVSVGTGWSHTGTRRAVRVPMS